MAADQAQPYDAAANIAELRTKLGEALALVDKVSGAAAVGARIQEALDELERLQ